MKRWRWVVDNQMRSYGDCDFVKRVIRINRSMHLRDKESLIDTLVHEELHALYPRYSEKRICAMTKRKLKRMTKNEKSRLYKLLPRGTCGPIMRFGKANLVSARLQTA